MIDIKEFNAFVEEYLEDTSLDDFEFIKDFNNIVLNNALFKKAVKYKEKLDIQMIVNLAYTFFKSLSEEYATYFEGRINDGTILFSENYEVG